MSIVYFLCKPILGQDKLLKQVVRVTRTTAVEKLLAFVQKLHAFATAKNNEAALLP